MRHAAHLVLDLEEHLAVVGIDDVDEAVLVRVALLADDPALQHLLVRAGEVGDVDGDVVAVVGVERLVGLAEDQLLRRAHADLGRHASRC